MNASVRKNPKVAPADRNRLNVGDPWELKYWCDVLGVQPERLKRAVLLAGVMLTDVRMYLKRQSLPDY